MIVNRIGVDHSVFDTAFISKRAGKIAEEIRRNIGLTVANEVKSKVNIARRLLHLSECS